MNLARSFDLPVWHFLGLLGTNGGISWQKGHHLLPWILRYTLLAPWRLWENFRFQRQVAQHKLAQPPLFVLGHWRSGTSYLQALLSQDPNMATCSLFQGVFAGCFLSTEGWLKPLLDRVSQWLGLQYEIQRVPLRMDLPVEEDFAMVCWGNPASYGWGFLFPQRFESWLDRLILMESASPAERQGWRAAYMFLVKKLAFGLGQRRLILKSPGNTARIGELLQLFPGAKFVYIHRDPRAVFHSTRKLWRMMQQKHALQAISEQEITRLTLLGYQKVMRAYQHQKSLIPAGNLVEVAYESLRAAPWEQLAAIYQQLELGALPRAPLAAFLERSQNYVPQSYVTSPEEEQLLQSQWRFAFAASPDR